MTHKQYDNRPKRPETDNPVHQDEQIPVLEDRILELPDHPPASAAGSGIRPEPAANHLADSAGKGGNPFLPYERLAELARERQTFNAELSKLLDQQQEHVSAAGLSGHQLDLLADRILLRIRPRLESLIRQILDEQAQTYPASSERKR